MSDEFTEVTNLSWFDRIKDSCAGLVFGIIIFLLAFPLIFWNEGRAVKTAASLKEGSKAVVSINVDTVNPANDQKLVHLTGEATTVDILTDSQFSISQKAIKLQRKVEIYQWKEEKKSEEKKKVGGGSQTVTTYSYIKAWSEPLIDSSSFKKAEEHKNPAEKPFPTEIKKAEKVTVGAFTLSSSLIERISKYEDYPVDPSMQKKLPKHLRGTIRTSSGAFYIGRDPANPQVGDAKITFSFVKPLTVSIIAQQSGSTFQPYKTKAGDAIERLQYGTATAAEMFQKAQEENTMMTWILRVVGFIMLFVGLLLFFKPISTFADVIPFFGDIAGAGLGVIAFLIALTCWTGAVATAWIAARPILGVLLIVVAIGAVAGIFVLSRKKAA
jgi:hypothetical protein